MTKLDFETCYGCCSIKWAFTLQLPETSTKLSDANPKHLRSLISNLGRPIKNLSNPRVSQPFFY